MDMLTQYSWPGNVRELQNEIRRAMALSDGALLGPDVLSPRLQKTHVKHASDIPEITEDDGSSGQLKHRIERMEAQLIRESMRRHNSNKTHVAQELGLTRVGLRMKLLRLGLEH
jgi:two-component system response regulator HupR/HoxA